MAFRVGDRVKATHPPYMIGWTGTIVRKSKRRGTDWRVKWDKRPGEPLRTWNIAADYIEPIDSENLAAALAKMLGPL